MSRDDATDAPTLTATSGVVNQDNEGATSKGRRNASVIVLLVAAAATLVVSVGVLVAVVGSDAEPVDTPSADRASDDLQVVESPASSSPASSPPEWSASAPTLAPSTTQPAAHSSVAPATAPTPAIVEWQPPRLIQPADVEASGHLPSSTLRCNSEVVTYGPDNLFDRDPQRGWGTGGNGRGTWALATLAEPTRLQRIGITAGYTRVGPRSVVGCADVSAFGFNRQIESVRYEFSDGTSTVHRLNPVEGLQWIDVDVVTSAVRVVVESTVLPPGADDDTVISDMELFGAPTDLSATPR